MTGFTSVVSGDTAITARGPVREAAERVLGRLWIDQVPVRLASEDPGLWPTGRDGAAVCWPGQPGSSRALLPRLRELRDAARDAGLTDVVLAGRGAAAHAAGLIVRCFADGTGAPPLVLDGADPAPVARLVADRARLHRAVVVLAGDDAGHDAVRQALSEAFAEIGLSPAEIAARFVVVAAPGSAAAKLAAKAGHPLVEAPAPTAFGALSPYALVPAALAGADVGALLDQAATVLPALTRPENNPGLVLGAILGGAVRAGRGTVVIGGYPATLPGLADWVAALLPAATGGRLLPLVQHGGVPVLPGEEVFLVTLDGRPHQDDATVSGPLAAQLVVWEYGAAVAAYLLGVDPLAPPRPDPVADPRRDEPLFVDGEAAGAVAAYTADPGLARARDLGELLDELVARAAAEGHLHIAAFLDPDPVAGQGPQVRRLAAVLAARAARPVTVGWGCRYPAIGNDHREKGVYLVLSGDVPHSATPPDRRHLLGPLQAARAAGAAGAAAAAGRPVVRLRLHDRREGLAGLLETARSGA
ncbi:glucose-6-phosphate isomerase [Actinomadura macrotermitis]|uniref:Glucose-6-phosphate isomerase n=1 Tax=Actinomadura macrotermitis TaxID=2585200 RepID=A0A7K0C511_9ACTN|nr:glucose-6-phosphate isomerase [Actinomadura macrotermitis]MQY08537.1 hypothetical protein [Actinomadura macrotermitis]